MTAPPTTASALALAPGLADLALPDLHERSEPAVVEVAIVDDHLPVREGLPPLLARHSIDVVSSAAASADAVAAIAAAAPAIALVGLGGESRPGLELARMLAVEAPGTAVLLLTDGPGDIEPSAALAAGAAGVLWKGAALATWAAGVRAVAEGRLWLERDEDAVEHGWDSLSERERRVLVELARGSSTEEAADVLHVSPHTVRTHVRNIQRKLGARTRVHAVALAFASGEITPPSSLV